MSSHDKDDVGLAIGLTFAAGLSTVIGSFLLWCPCISAETVNVLPISLAFSAGVMIYISFIEIIFKAQESFEEELHDHENPVLLAHLYTSATFFGGIAFGYLLDYIVHALGYSHVTMNVQKHPDSPNPEDLPKESPHHIVPNQSSVSDAQPDSPGANSGQIKMAELNQQVWYLVEVLIVYLLIVYPFKVNAHFESIVCISMLIPI